MASPQKHVETVFAIAVLLVCVCGCKRQAGEAKPPASQPATAATTPEVPADDLFDLDQVLATKIATSRPTTSTAPAESLLDEYLRTWSSKPRGPFEPEVGMKIADAKRYFTVGKEDFSFRQNQPWMIIANTKVFMAAVNGDGKISQLDCVARVRHICGKWMLWFGQDGQDEPTPASEPSSLPYGQ